MSGLRQRADGDDRRRDHDRRLRGRARGIWFDRYELMRVDESHESAGFGGAVARFDESVYVEVRFSGGGGWGATLHTPEGVRAILGGWRRVSGEHSGLYFWAPGVILIRELAPSEHIVALVEGLMAEEELELAFVPLEHDRHAP